MKIIHMSDTHLGFRQFSIIGDEGRNVREEDVYRVFRDAVDLVLERRPTAVIHSGDLFDGYHPSNHALAVALDELARLRDAEIPFVVSAGNHSTPRYSSGGSVFSVLSRFGVEAVWNEARTIRIGSLSIQAIPHHPDPNAMLASIREARPDSSADANVLVMHAGMEGLPAVGSAEVASVALAADAVEAAGDFDYIAMGHIHSFTPVRLNACYAGSLERLGFGDRSPKKGIVEIDFNMAPEHRIRFLELETRPVHDLQIVDLGEEEDVAQRVIEAASELSLDGSIVRLRLVGISRDLFRVLDRRRLDEAFGECLHVQFAPVFSDAPALAVSGSVDLRTFLMGRNYGRLDTSEIINRAERYVAMADVTEES